MEQRARKFALWGEPFVTLRLPKVFNLRMDPFERADTDANAYDNWRLRQLYTLVPSQVVVGQFMKTMKEYPRRQAPFELNVEEIIDTLSKANNN